MDDLTAIIFPHSYVSEEVAKRVLSLFDRITIFEPWYGEPPEHVKRIDAIEVRHPPESLKLSNEFLHLLGEYKGWIAQHADKSFVEFLKASKGLDGEEDTTWQIRKLVRMMGKKGQPATLENLPLRWHMVLHLARELEEQRDEADQALKRLREKKSPLEGVLEDESELQDLFDDIPRLSEEPSSEGYKVEPVVEAWTRLFGGYLKEGDFLVTMNPGIMDYITELWDEEGGPGDSLGENLVTFKWPDLSSLNFEEMWTAKEDIRSDDQLEKLRSIIRDMGNDPRRSLRRLREYSKDLEWKGRTGSLEFQVRYLDTKQDSDRERDDSVTKLLAGKTLFLLKD